jgi:hypothetical protein
MVNQPAYISNLKAYSRTRYGSGTEAAHTVDDLSNESDRGAVILATTAIEDILEHTIITRLPGLSADEAARKRMFENDGVLSSFSKKTEMAYAMGIIDGECRKKIDIVREIRNACAHSRKPLSFDKEVLASPCRIVIGDMIKELKDQTPATIRLAFIVECSFISLTIGTGKKFDTYEARFAEFERVTRQLDGNSS